MKSFYIYILNEYIYVCIILTIIVKLRFTFVLIDKK